MERLHMNAYINEWIYNVRIYFLFLLNSGTCLCRIFVQEIILNFGINLERIKVASSFFLFPSL